MKPRFLLLTATLLFSIFALGQFRFDDVLFKTVDPGELCKTLENNKGYLLLDVRSPGEYADTSRFAGYNLGHLDGAVNIDIRQLGPRIKELAAHRNKPVFVYCSHSQRSRRALKMLADSGFTSLYNINGGMSAIHYMSLKEKECYPNLFKTQIAYDNISINQLAEHLSPTSSRNPFIIDVRPDSAFRHISRDASSNSIGTIYTSTNIPADSMANRISKLPKDREIILVDLYGDEAAKSAQYLINNGFTKVSILTEGMERALTTDGTNNALRSIYVNPVKIGLINSTEFGKYLSSNPEITIIDIRTTDEFQNKHKDGWRNIGHIRNAVHIPGTELESKLGTIDRKKPIIVYGIGSGNEVFQAAMTLYKNNFKDVRVLMGGLFNLRWSSGNIKGQKQLADLVVEVPAENQ